MAKELGWINNHVLEQVMSSGRRIKVVALIFAFAIVIFLLFEVILLWC